MCHRLSGRCHTPGICCLSDARVGEMGSRGNVLFTDGSRRGQPRACFRISMRCYRSLRIDPNCAVLGEVCVATPERGTVRGTRRKRYIGQSGPRPGIAQSRVLVPPHISDGVIARLHRALTERRIVGRT